MAFNNKARGGFANNAPNMLGLFPLQLSTGDCDGGKDLFKNAALLLFPFRAQCACEIEWKTRAPSAGFHFAEKCGSIIFRTRDEAVEMGADVVHCLINGTRLGGEVHGDVAQAFQNPLEIGLLAARILLECNEKDRGSRGERFFPKESRYPERRESHLGCLSGRELYGGSRRMEAHHRSNSAM